MPYPSSHKPRTRARILASARHLFAKSGFDGVSIDRVMEGAGLTRGGFYAHFTDKEQLFIEAIMTGVVAVEPVAHSDKQLRLEALVRSYLSDAHVSQPADGCPLITFPSEVARGSTQIKNAYQAVSVSIADAFSSHIDGEDASSRGLAVLAIVVGASVLIRGIDDPAISESIRSAAIDQALMIAAPSPSRR